MAAEAHAPTASEYIVHHLQHLQNVNQTKIVDFTVINYDSIIVGLVLAFIVSPALAVFIQLMRHLKIELTDTEIRFLRMGRPFRVIPFANHHFTSLYIVHNQESTS